MVNSLLEQWKELMLQASEALGQNNYTAYDNAMLQLNDTYDRIKEENSLRYECVNFGMSNHIFENIMPSLFLGGKNGRKVIKEFMDLMQNDNNLRSQLQFYSSLNNYNDIGDVKDYINEALDIVKKQIDVKTLSESNNKLNKLIKKYDLKPSEHISKEAMGLYEACDYLMKNDKKLGNLSMIHASVDKVGKFIMENKDKKVSDGVLTIDEISKRLSNNLDNILTEEERRLVDDIIDSKSNMAEQRQEKLFNKFKNECLALIDKVMLEAKDNEKENLLKIKEQITSKQFCKESLIKDMAKLLEIRDILMS